MDTNVSSITFLSAYKGEHHYLLQLRSGAQHRLTVRGAPIAYDEKNSHQDKRTFDRSINGQFGLIACGSAAILTDELIATFNRFAFQDYEKQLKAMLAAPKIYGAVVRVPFPVYVAGNFDTESGTWTAVSKFETIRDLAGIPPEHCFDPLGMGSELSLVA